MIKRTLYFGNPAYLHLSDGQLKVRLPEVERNADLPLSFKKEAIASIPVEDIGIIELDHQQITLTQALLDALMQNNTVVMVCDKVHHPSGLLLPLSGHTLQNERFRSQLEASEPLKKQLWAQTVTRKIMNQAGHFKRRGLPHSFFVPLYKNVKSGDSDNAEATAAAHYWQRMFPQLPHFRRHREGPPPNHLFNYAYAVLRAVMARSIVGAGLLPTLGIFHRNRYNAFCLADDLMEPYRPIADELVLSVVDERGAEAELNREVKAELLKLPAVDVQMEDEKSPLMVGMQRTAVSLVKCFEGTQRKLLFPVLEG
jgi:CRISP-associated protein Cas1